MTPLQKAAQDTIERWDAPLNKVHMGMEALRKALADEKAQDGFPVAWGMVKNGLMLDIICPDEHESFEGDYTIPLYTRPSPPHSRERTELIAKLVSQWASLDPSDPYRNDIGRAAEMLNDDQQKDDSYLIEALQAVVDAAGPGSGIEYGKAEEAIAKSKQGKIGVRNGT